MDRFTVVDDYTGVQRDDDGKWVKYEDAAAEKRRADEAEHRVAELEARLAAVKEIADLSPELNMCNYDEDQVRDLNNAMNKICAALSGSRALAVVEGRIHTITGDDVAVVADLPGQIGSYPRTVTVVVLDASVKE